MRLDLSEDEARPLHRLLWPRPEVANRPETDPRTAEPASAAVPTQVTRQDGLLTASVLDNRVGMGGHDVMPGQRADRAG
jgi:hypothetical protein